MQVAYVAVWNRLSRCCGMRLQHYVVFWSREAPGNVGSRRRMNEDSAWGVCGYEWAPADAIGPLITPCLVEARQIKIELPGNNRLLELAEVQVFGLRVPPPTHPAPPSNPLPPSSPPDPPSLPNPPSSPSPPLAPPALPVPPVPPDLLTFPPLPIAPNIESGVVAGDAKGLDMVVIVVSALIGVVWLASGYYLYTTCKWQKQQRAAKARFGMNLDPSKQWMNSSHHSHTEKYKEKKKKKNRGHASRRRAHSCADVLEAVERHELSRAPAALVPEKPPGNGRPRAFGNIPFAPTLKARSLSCGDLSSALRHDLDLSRLTTAEDMRSQAAAAKAYQRAIDEGYSEAAAQAAAAAAGVAASAGEAVAAAAGVAAARAAQKAVDKGLASVVVSAAGAAAGAASAAGKAALKVAAAGVAATRAARQAVVSGHEPAAAAAAGKAAGLAASNGKLSTAAAAAGVAAADAYKAAIDAGMSVAAAEAAAAAAGAAAANGRSSTHAAATGSAAARAGQQAKDNGKGVVAEASAAAAAAAAMENGKTTAEAAVAGVAAARAAQKAMDNESGPEAASVAGKASGTAAAAGNEPAVCVAAGAAAADAARTALLAGSALLVAEAAGKAAGQAAIMAPVDDDDDDNVPKSRLDNSRAGRRRGEGARDAIAKLAAIDAKQQQEVALLVAKAAEAMGHDDEEELAPRSDGTRSRPRRRLGEGGAATMNALAGLNVKHAQERAKLLEETEDDDDAPRSEGDKSIAGRERGAGSADALAAMRALDAKQAQEREKLLAGAYVEDNDDDDDDAPMSGGGKSAAGRRRGDGGAAALAKMRALEAEQAQQRAALLRGSDDVNDEDEDETAPRSDGGKSGPGRRVGRGAGAAARALAALEARQAEQRSALVAEQEEEEDDEAPRCGAGRSGAGRRLEHRTRDRVAKLAALEEQHKLEVAALMDMAEGFAADAAVDDDDDDDDDAPRSAARKSRAGRQRVGGCEASVAALRALNAEQAQARAKLLAEAAAEDDDDGDDAPKSSGCKSRAGRRAENREKSLAAAKAMAELEAKYASERSAVIASAEQQQEEDDEEPAPKSEGDRSAAGRKRGRRDKAAAAGAAAARAANAAALLGSAEIAIEAAGKAAGAALSQGSSPNGAAEAGNAAAKAAQIAIDTGKCTEAAEAAGSFAGEAMTRGFSEEEAAAAASAAARAAQQAMEAGGSPAVAAASANAAAEALAAGKSVAEAASVGATAAADEQRRIQSAATESAVVQAKQAAIDAGRSAEAVAAAANAAGDVATSGLPASVAMSAGSAAGRAFQAAFEAGKGDAAASAAARAAGLAVKLAWTKQGEARNGRDSDFDTVMRQSLGAKDFHSARTKVKTAAAAAAAGSAAARAYQAAMSSDKGHEAAGQAADAAGRAASEGRSAAEAACAGAAAARAAQCALKAHRCSTAVSAASRVAGAAAAAGKTASVSATAGVATARAVQKAIDQCKSPQAATVAGDVAADAIIAGATAEVAAEAGSAAARAAQRAIDTGAGPAAIDAAARAAGEVVISGGSPADAAAAGLLAQKTTVDNPLVTPLQRHGVDDDATVSALVTPREIPGATPGLTRAVLDPERVSEEERQRMLLLRIAELVGSLRQGSLLLPVDESIEMEQDIDAFLVALQLAEAEDLACKGMSDSWDTMETSSARWRWQDAWIEDISTRISELRSAPTRSLPERSLSFDDISLSAEERQKQRRSSLMAGDGAEGMLSGKDKAGRRVMQRVAEGSGVRMKESSLRMTEQSTQARERSLSFDSLPERRRQSQLAEREAVCRRKTNGALAAKALAALAAKHAQQRSDLMAEQDELDFDEAAPREVSDRSHAGRRRGDCTRDAVAQLVALDVKQKKEMAALVGIAEGFAAAGVGDDESAASVAALRALNAEQTQAREAVLVKLAADVEDDEDAPMSQARRSGAGRRRGDGGAAAFAAMKALEAEHLLQRTELLQITLNTAMPAWDAEGLHSSSPDDEADVMRRTSRGVEAFRTMYSQMRQGLAQPQVALPREPGPGDRLSRAQLGDLYIPAFEPSQHMDMDMGSRDSLWSAMMDEEKADVKSNKERPGRRQEHQSRQQQSQKIRQGKAAVALFMQHGRKRLTAEQEAAIVEMFALRLQALWRGRMARLEMMSAKQAWEKQGSSSSGSRDSDFSEMLRVSRGVKDFRSARSRKQPRRRDISSADRVSRAELGSLRIPAFEPSRFTSRFTVDRQTGSRDSDFESMMRMSRGVKDFMSVRSRNGQIAAFKRLPMGETRGSARERQQMDTISSRDRDSLWSAMMDEEKADVKSNKERPGRRQEHQSRQQQSQKIRQGKAAVALFMQHGRKRLTAEQEAAIVEMFALRLQALWRGRMARLEATTTRRVSRISSRHNSVTIIRVSRASLCNRDSLWRAMMDEEEADVKINKERPGRRHEHQARKEQIQKIQRGKAVVAMLIEHGRKKLSHEQEAAVMEMFALKLQALWRGRTERACVFTAKELLEESTKKQAWEKQGTSISKDGGRDSDFEAMLRLSRGIKSFRSARSRKGTTTTKQLDRLPLPESKAATKARQQMDQRSEAGRRDSMYSVMLAEDRAGMNEMKERAPRRREDAARKLQSHKVKAGRAAVAIMMRQGRRSLTEEQLEAVEYLFAARLQALWRGRMVRKEKQAWDKQHAWEASLERRPETREQKMASRKRSMFAGDGAEDMTGARSRPGRSRGKDKRSRGNVEFSLDLVTPGGARPAGALGTIYDEEEFQPSRCSRDSNGLDQHAHGLDHARSKKDKTASRKQSMFAGDNAVDMCGTRSFTSMRKGRGNPHKTSTPTVAQWVSEGWLDERSRPRISARASTRISGAEAHVEAQAQAEVAAEAAADRQAVAAARAHAEEEAAAEAASAAAEAEAAAKEQAEAEAEAEAEAAAEAAAASAAEAEAEAEAESLDDAIAQAEADARAHEQSLEAAYALAEKRASELHADSSDDDDENKTKNETTEKQPFHRRRRHRHHRRKETTEANYEEQQRRKIIMILPRLRVHRGNSDDERPHQDRYSRNDPADSERGAHVQASENDAAEQSPRKGRRHRSRKQQAEGSGKKFKHHRKPEDSDAKEKGIGLTLPQPLVRALGRLGGIYRKAKPASDDGETTEPAANEETKAVSVEYSKEEKAFLRKARRRSSSVAPRAVEGTSTRCCLSSRLVDSSPPARNADGYTKSEAAFLRKSRRKSSLAAAAAAKEEESFLRKARRRSSTPIAPSAGRRSSRRSTGASAAPEFSQIDRMDELAELSMSCTSPSSPQSEQKRNKLAIRKASLFAGDSASDRCGTKERPPSRRARNSGDRSSARHGSRSSSRTSSRMQAVAKAVAERSSTAVLETVAEGMAEESGAEAQLLPDPPVPSYDAATCDAPASQATAPPVEAAAVPAEEATAEDSPRPPPLRAAPKLLVSAHSAASLRRLTPLGRSSIKDSDENATASARQAEATARGAAPAELHAEAEAAGVGAQESDSDSDFEQPPLTDEEHLVLAEERMMMRAIRRSLAEQPPSMKSGDELRLETAQAMLASAGATAAAARRGTVQIVSGSRLLARASTRGSSSGAPSCGASSSTAPLAKAGDIMLQLTDDPPPEQKQKQQQQQQKKLALECPICLDEYDLGLREPMVLPCSGAHGLCNLCVGKLRKPGKPFRCPHCREPIAANKRINPNRGMLEFIERVSVSSWSIDIDALTGASDEPSCPRSGSAPGRASGKNVMIF